MMLSDYLFTGVVAGTAMLNLGLLAQALVLDPHSSLVERGLPMYLLAMVVLGVGVMAVTYGMLVLFADTSGAAGVSATLAMLVPAIVFGVPAVLLTRPGDRDGVRAAMLLMLVLIGVVALLVANVALMALLLSDVDASGLDPIMLAATAAVAAATIGGGVAGSRGLRQMNGEPVGGPEASGPHSGWRPMIVAGGLLLVAWIATFGVMAMFFLR
jgi:hypothetical protein